jgi:hypothetical protein
MNPDNNQNPTPHTPASLPAVPLPTQPTAAVPVQPPQVAPPNANLAQAASLQAKSLVSQYQQDPYRLSGAIQQLKAQFLAEQFQITPKSADE